MHELAQPSRLRLAELSSTTGAGLLGIGVGVLMAAWLRALGMAFVALGLVLHGWGMLDKHRLEQGAARPRWSTALYWVCWLALGALAVTVVLRALR